MHIIGASGHSKVVIDILKLNNQEISGLWDDNPELEDFQGLKVDGNLTAFKKSVTSSAIIAIGNNKIRQAIANEIKTPFGLAIHPSSSISKSVTLKEGTVVMANASINAETTIGKHVIINTNASVDHDCVLEDYVHISPKVALAGNVKVGEGAHIGIGACVIQGIKIGRWATVGAGAVVIRDVPEFTTVVGNPAQILNKIQTV